MWKIRYYVPLFGFVVPTAVIGFGFVIPRSCIAGVNELSVGFATTILGAAMTYTAGIRSATQIACPASTPWRVRVARYINRQAASPRGPIGRLLGFIWTLEHRRLNRATLALLELERSHHSRSSRRRSGQPAASCSHSAPMIRACPRVSATRSIVSTRPPK